MLTESLEELKKIKQRIADLQAKASALSQKMHLELDKEIEKMTGPGAEPALVPPAAAKPPRARTKVTQEQIDEVNRLCREGKTYPEVAAIVGLGAFTVGAISRRSRKPIPNSP